MSGVTIVDGPGDPTVRLQPADGTTIVGVLRADGTWDGPDDVPAELLDAARELAAESHYTPATFVRRAEDADRLDLLVSLADWAAQLGAQPYPDVCDAGERVPAATMQRIVTAIEHAGRISVGEARPPNLSTAQPIPDLVNNIAGAGFATITLFSARLAQYLTRPDREPDRAALLAGALLGAVAAQCAMTNEVKARGYAPASLIDHHQIREHRP